MTNKGKVLKAMFLTMVAGLMFARPHTTVEAQRLGPSENTKQLTQRLESNVDHFEDILFSALDRSKLNGGEKEDTVAGYMTELERSTDRLEGRVDHGPIAADVARVLGDALRIETFLQGNFLSPSVTASWERVKGDLNDLARVANIRWIWIARKEPPLTDSVRRAQISRLETRTDEFRESFDDALDQSRADGKPIEGHMNAVVETFERSIDDLDARVGRRERVDEKNVLTVLNNGLAIDGYMQRYRMTLRARVDWARVKAELDDLSRMYNVAWVWTVKPDRTTITPADAEKPKR